MNYGLWIMSYGLWIMSYGLWVMGYGLLIVNYLSFDLLKSVKILVVIVFFCNFAV